MKLKHQILAALACLIWSSAMVFIKIGLKEMPPFLFSGMRFMLAGILLMPFLKYSRENIEALKKNKLMILGVSFFQTGFLYGTMFIAMQYVRGAQAAIIIGSSPIIYALAAHFLQKNDKMTLKKSLIISIGILGIVIVSLSTKPWMSEGGMEEFLGMLLLLFGTISSSLANVSVSNNSRAVPPLLLNAVQMFLGGCMLICVGLFFEPLPSVFPSNRFLFSLFALSAISAIGFSIWFYLLGFVKVSMLNTWKFIIPVGGAIFSWTFLKEESPDIYALCGILFICISIIFYQKKIK